MNEYEGLHVYYHAQLKSSLIKGDVLILRIIVLYPSLSVLV